VRRRAFVFRRPADRIAAQRHARIVDDARQLARLQVRRNDNSLRRLRELALHQREEPERTRDRFLDAESQRRTPAGRGNLEHVDTDDLGALKMESSRQLRSLCATAVLAIASLAQAACAATPPLGAAGANADANANANANANATDS